MESGEESSAGRSRLLTKKQLSEMAWGVRELSKRLGSIRLKLKVRTVFILTKAHDEELIGNTRDMVRWLLSSDRDVRYTVYVEDNLKQKQEIQRPRTPCGSREGTCQGERGERRHQEDGAAVEILGQRNVQITAAHLRFRDHSRG